MSGFCRVWTVSFSNLLETLILYVAGLQGMVCCVFHFSLGWVNWVTTGLRCHNSPDFDVSSFYCFSSFVTSVGLAEFLETFCLGIVICRRGKVRVWNLRNSQASLSFFTYYVLLVGRQQL